MAIHLKESSDYKELSQIFLKQIDSYTEICKVYICTGPGQYELLFDNCEGTTCDGSEDGECSDCLVKWLSIYDDLLLDTDGVHPEGLLKVICPTTECDGAGNYGNLNSTCMDDTICCNCNPLSIEIDVEICQPLLQIQCPCLALDTEKCSGLPSYINNACKAYVWTALGGDLQEDNSCNSCIDSSKTVIGRCCSNNKRYTYIKNVTWNNDPTLESNCGIKRNCPSYFYLTNVYPDQTFTDFIDYGYSFETEGGIASENDGNPKTGSCPFTCTNPLSRCYVNCQCFVGTDEDWCKEACGTSLGGRCREIWENNNELWDEYVCSKCEQYQIPNCCNSDNPSCDICADDPCTAGCIRDCSYEDIQWCSAFCKANGEINWDCLLQSGEGLDIGEIITFLRNKNCPCAPDFDGCNDICYDYFGTDL